MSHVPQPGDLRAEPELAGSFLLSKLEESWDPHEELEKKSLIVMENSLFLGLFLSQETKMTH